MNHLFVLYQEALELKNLGFDEPCFGFYYKDITTPSVDYWNTPNNNLCKNSNLDKNIVAPLYSQVFDWFREKYNLQHEVFYQDNLIKNGFKITDISTNTELTEFIFKPNYFENRGYEYKECELACLQKLITICKNDNTTRS